MKLTKTSLFVLTLWSSASFASNESQSDLPKEYRQNLSGYTQIIVDTDAEQKDPLIKVVSIEIPSSIVNTGQALNYVLYATGYQLKDLRETDKETLNLYSKKVPLVNRSFFRSTVKQILQTMIGSAYDISIDHVSRTITISARA